MDLSLTWPANFLLFFQSFYALPTPLYSLPQKHKSLFFCVLNALVFNGQLKLANSGHSLCRKGMHSSVQIWEKYQLWISTKPSYQTLHALTDNLHNAYKKILPSHETITWMNSSSPGSSYWDSIIIVHKYHQQSMATSPPCSSAWTHRLFVPFVFFSFWSYMPISLIYC